MASPPEPGRKRAGRSAGPAQAPHFRNAWHAWHAWRIADGRFEVFSAVGASLVGGRWNSPGLAVIYASRTFSGAMLECLAQAGIGRVPRKPVAVEIAIAGAVAVESHDEHSLPAGWDHGDLVVARAFGDAWVRERRSAVLVVPSVVARREGHVVLNPAHPDVRRLQAGTPEPVLWDARLFGRR